MIEFTQIVIVLPLPPKRIRTMKIPPRVVILG